MMTRCRFFLCAGFLCLVIFGMLACDEQAEVNFRRNPNNYLAAQELLRWGRQEKLKNVGAPLHWKFGIYEHEKIDYTSHNWDDQIRPNEPHGGLICVAELPVRVNQDEGKMYLVSLTFGFPFQNDTDPSVYSFDLFPALYVSSEKGISFEKGIYPENGLFGNVKGRRVVDGQFYYLEEWSFRGGPAGWTAFTVKDENLIVINKKRYPKVEDKKNRRDLVNLGKMTEAEYAKWEKDAYMWAEGFEEFSPKIKWTTVAEFIKSDKPVWRDTPVPESKDELQELRKVTPALSYEEFAKWCRENESAVSANTGSVQK